MLHTEKILSPIINIEELWLAVLGELQLQLPQHSYNTWLKGTYISSFTDHTIEIAVTSAFALDWLERRCYQSIEKTLEKITNIKYDIRFTIHSPANKSTSESPSVQSHNSPDARLSKFNSAYTFETFIEGDNNSLAFNASLAVCSHSTVKFNPLFIYSDVGLGKTHLLHSIGHLGKTLNRNVLYTTGEKFTNDFIFSIRNRSTESFKDTYRSADILLIDDIQFISGKEQTQEGFFHIFNDLHHSGTDIIITADQSPEKLNHFQQRLSSRFEWGLIADIQKPTLETRIAIIQQKVNILNLNLDPSIIELIAKHATKNIRQIEGIINKISAHATFMNVPLTYDNTVTIIQTSLKQFRSRLMNKEEVISTVANFYSVSIEGILSKQRDADLVKARQITMYLLKKELNLTTSEIGRYLGNRNHSTVIHGIDKISKLIINSTEDKKIIFQIQDSFS